MGGQELPSYTPHTITDPEILSDELDQVRRQGYAVTREERDIGAASISAPVFGPGGKLLGAIGIAGPAGRFTQEAMASWIPRVQWAASKLSARMGYRDPNGHQGDDARTR